MEILNFFLEFVLHIDKYLDQIIVTYGTLTYAILFLIIFLETGLVFTPFLPGDSLLFAAGAFSALGSLNIFLLIAILIVAAILGDTSNYWIGHFFGEKILSHPRSPLSEDHLKKTEDFFKKHGGKTIILARFIPIVRTFAPFIAGAGQMNYSKFIFFNVIGGIIWVPFFTLTGYLFGNIPFVKKNFSLFILIIILISVFPLALEFIKNKKIGSKQ